MIELQIFNYQTNQIRTVLRNGEPWWIAKDVCEILDIRTNSIRDILDNDEISTFNPNDNTIDIGMDRVLDQQTIGKNITFVEAGRGGKDLLIISESGLYSLVLKSRKPEAKSFKRWITHEVIPAIRKHGGYLTPAKIEEVLLNPDTIIRLATDLKAEREKRKQLETEIEDQKPKVLFADAVTSSKSSVLVGELAKILKQNGIEIGQNRLFEWLREEGYLCKSGENYNLPTQYSMELELMEIKKVTINNPDGSSRITRTPKITGKGQVYFVNKFLNNQLLSTGTTG